MPAQKATVPLSFCGREKKRRAFWKPMMRVRPIRKRIYRDRSVGCEIGGRGVVHGVRCPWRVCEEDS